MKKLIVVLLSLLTLIGGHLVNRRWDRVLLFLGVLIALYLATMILFSGISMSPDIVMSPDTLKHDLGTLAKTYLGALTLLICVSTVMAYRDATTPKEGAHWSAGAITGGLFQTVFAMLFVFFSGAIGYNYLTDFDESLSSKTTTHHSRVIRYNFSNYIYLGDNHNSDKKLPPPPTGPAQLTGRFLFDGKPAEGVELSIVLNGLYESKKITTDNRGEFHLPLPAGEWNIPLIKTESWSHKPEGENFSVLTGFEPKFTGDNYDPHGWWHNGSGITVTVDEHRQSSPIELNIVRNIEPIWPNRDDEADKATFDTSVISWQPVPQAHNYMVKIDRIERNGDTTSYHPVIKQHVSKSNSLPLYVLPSSSAKVGMATEYGVSVYAFDEEGKLINETDHWSSNITFQLADGNQLLDQSDMTVISSSGIASSKGIDELMTNRKRLQAVEILIDEGMHEAANTLLHKITGRTEAGRREAMLAYLAAEKNQCGEAQKWFDKAMIAGGDSCAPSSYLRKCQSPLGVGANSFAPR